MIYGIYPQKDTTLYENNYDLNTGIDQLLELNKSVNTATDITYNSRILMKFDLSEFSSSIASGTITNPKYFLRLFVDDAQEVPVAYDIEAYPISGSWEMGVGKFEEVPEIHDGATWLYRDNFTDQTLWYTGSQVFPPDTTGSYVSYPGGGAWYTNYSASQSFEYENADVEMDVTDIVEAWLTGSIPNEGFILKWTDLQESGSDELTSLKFFSRESHTIYLPRLEVRWDDSNFITSSVSSTFTQSSSASGTYFGTLEYPEVPELTFGSNCEVSSSTVNTVTSASVWRTTIVDFPGTILSGSVSINNATGVFSGSYSGSLDMVDVTGSYSGSVKGYCNSNGVVTNYSEWAVVCTDITGSFAGEFIGIYDGTISGSGIGYYEGQLTASYDGTIVTQSLQAKMPINDTEYYVSSSVNYFVTCSETITPLSADGKIIVYLQGFNDYVSDSKVKVNVLAREQFPQLRYVTESVNYQVNYLPETSYYAVYDGHSEETIIDFDADYTKISCSTSGSYFNFWVGLQPERNYRFKFKVVRDGLEEIIDNGFYFKVKR